MRNWKRKIVVLVVAVAIVVLLGGCAASRINSEGVVRNGYR